MGLFQINRHHSETCGNYGSENESKCDCISETDYKKSDQERIEELVKCIVTCCGQIGSLTIGNATNKTYSFCNQTDYKIQKGLAYAVVESLEKQESTDAPDLIDWFGLCLIKLGYDPDDRINAILDALRDELLSREHNLINCENGTCEGD
ncbi:MAG TPA: hypothetical protein DCO70_09175 [Verrucomicrobiales bacterium]|nr:hypothetical protein [Verrucomicrobiales bacterium]|tara:strand:+ start:335 stop:784 length:450 start_codon:yes stop_codon:yes gene_type:complete